MKTLGFALISFNQTLGCLGKTPTSGVYRRRPSVRLCVCYLRIDEGKSLLKNRSQDHVQFQDRMNNRRENSLSKLSDKCI